jgi:hypothetical protein
MAQQRPGFNFNTLSTATKILLIAGVLLLIDTFLAWQSVCGGVAGIATYCFHAGAMSGSGGIFGVLMFIVLLALLGWEIAQLAGAKINLQWSPALVSAALAGAVVLFGVIKLLLAVTNSPGLGAWIGIILLAAIAYGGYMRWQESKAGGTAPGTAPAGPTTGGGFSS